MEPFAQTQNPLVVDQIVQSILDGASLVAFLVLLLLVFLAAVRIGRVRAPWANRLFLDPVDRARAKRAEIEKEIEEVAPAAQAVPEPAPETKGDVR